jgi:hypothetical protein
MTKFSIRQRVAVVATIIAVLGVGPAARAFAFNPQPDPPARSRGAYAWNPQPDPPRAAYAAASMQPVVMTTTNAAL